MEKIKIVDVTADNVDEAGVCCIKDKKADGYHAKINWFQSKLNAGLKIKIAVDADGKQLGFIEFIPSELAWRPIQADNYLFIQCIVVSAKKTRQQGLGSLLIQQCEKEAKALKKSGICVMSSKGAWLANKTLFEKNDFVVADQKGRFELMVKSFGNDAAKPVFIDWTKKSADYTGWNLEYADQCPWHIKSVNDLKQAAIDHDIVLKIKKIKSPREAQQGPSGFGTFALIKDGKLLADHYISRTRFENIIRKEIK